MSYFNDEQKDYMKELSQTDPAKLCWCGWFTKGQCYGAGRCNETVPGLSAADKIAARCPKCKNAPWAPGLKITHIKGCSNA